MNRVFKNELAKNEVPEMQQIVVTQPKSVLQQVANAASSTEATQELASSETPFRLQRASPDLLPSGERRQIRLIRLEALVGVIRFATKAYMTS